LFEPRLAGFKHITNSRLNACEFVEKNIDCQKKNAAEVDEHKEQR